MADNGNSLLLILTFIVALLLLIGSFTWFATPVIEVPTAKDIAAKISIPEIPETPVINLSSVEDRLTDIETTLNEDDTWEDEAETLATEEWEENDYRDIYRAINEIAEDNEDIEDIDDRDDIDYVTVKDTEVSGDVDDRDAEVTQDVKVKYEDVNGDTRKVYLTITTEIVEGEIENQDIDITP